MLLRSLYRYTYKCYVKDGPTKGPTIKLAIKHSQFYSLKITIPYSQALNPNKRFEINAISDKDEFLRFLKEEYYGFKPFKDHEYIGQEDIKNPIIRKYSGNEIKCLGRMPLRGFGQPPRDCVPIS